MLYFDVFLLFPFWSEISTLLGYEIFWFSNPTTNRSIAANFPLVALGGLRGGSLHRSWDFVGGGAGFIQYEG